MKNNTIQFLLLVLATFNPAMTASISAADAITLGGNWKLTESSIGYKVDHPMKTAVGSSNQAKGKGRCSAEGCEFLIAVSVVSFNSGDSNRDLHMLETTKGATNPLITVRSQFKPTALQGAKLLVDFDMEFAGAKVRVRGVELTLTRKDKSSLQADGVLKIKLTDFMIVRPSLLGMSVDDDVPIQIHSVWVQ